MVAILTEHIGGKWPFWLSPRQIIIIPVSSAFNDYAKYLTDTLNSFEFYAEMDPTSNTLNKKIRNAQIAQWNYQAIVGVKEESNMSVNLRSRDSKDPLGDLSLTALITKLKGESTPSSVKFNEFVAYKGRMPEGALQTSTPASAAPAAKPGGGASPKASPTVASKGAAPKGAVLKGAGGGDTNEAHLENHPYMGGFVPSKKDADLFASATSVPKTPNMARWYEHISSFAAKEVQSWP